MLRLLLLLAGFSASAFAQFFSLTTPADGSRVYFATPLRQKDTTQPTYGKLFHVDDSGLKLFLARDVVHPPPPGLGGIAFTNAYSLSSADVSSDGQVFAATGSRDCVGFYLECNKALYISTTTITSNGQPQDYEGTLKLSHNGKWAFGGYHINYIG
jgi:hypothetical protein